MMPPARDHRADHRWYMAGVWGFFLASGIQGVLFPWIIAFDLNDSSERVGIAQMLSMLPMLVLGMFGGAAADRAELRIHLMRLQAFSILPPIALALFITNGHLLLDLKILSDLMLSSLDA